MAKRKKDRPDGKKFAELVAAGMTHKTIAKKYDVTPATVAGALRTYRLSNKDAQKFKVVDFGKPLQLEGDYMVFGDLHLPTTLYDFFKLMIRVAKKYGVRKVIGAGDIYNMDFCSKYQFATEPITWAQEREAGRVIMQELTDSFDEVVLLMGNHDRRMQKYTNGAFDETDIFGLLSTNEKIITSNFGYCFVNSGGQDWLITHGSNYSVNQLTVADKLAQKYQMNVISHHEHHLAKGWDSYKHHVIINNGGLFDVKQLAYVNLDSNKMPNMANGFTMLKDGVGSIFSNDPVFTDWNMILD